MTTTTITARDLANGLRDGSIVAEAEETSLAVQALADCSGPECYPDTTIEFRRGDEVVAQVGCWVLGQYMRGPNRHDNGAYIGDGWQWQQDSDDGQTTGRPRHDVRDDVATWQESAGSLESLSLDIEVDEDGDPTPAAEEDVETIQDAIDAAYGEIDASPADEREVYEALVAQRCSDADLDAEVGDETVTLALYCGRDAGRTVYTFAGAEEVWEDADRCVAAAKEAFADRLAATAEAVREADHQDVIEALERRLADD